MVTIIYYLVMHWTYLAGNLFATSPPDSQYIPLHPLSHCPTFLCFLFPVNETLIHLALSIIRQISATLQSPAATSLHVPCQLSTYDAIACQYSSLHFHHQIPEETGFKHFRWCLITSGTGLLGRTNKLDPIIVVEPPDDTAGSRH